MSCRPPSVKWLDAGAGAAFNTGWSATWGFQRVLTVGSIVHYRLADGRCTPAVVLDFRTHDGSAPTVDIILLDPLCRVDRGETTDSGVRLAVRHDDPDAPLTSGSWHFAEEGE